MPIMGVCPPNNWFRQRAGEAEVFVRSVALRYFAVLVVVVLGLGIPGVVRAQKAEDSPIKVGGVEIKVASEEYLAVKAANVRAKPDSQGKLIGRIEQGARIHILGKVGSWLALKTEDGKEGFSYGPVFLPLIDGTLEKDISVNAKIPGGGTCAIQIVFEGKTIVEEEMFEVSDYQGLYDCKRGGKELSFTAYMFITEAPYALNQTPHYQINVDLRGIGKEYDEIFSTVFIYKKDKGVITYDGVTLKGYDRKLDEQSRSVATVAEVVQAAAEMAPKAWGAKVWSELESPLPR